MQHHPKKHQGKCPFQPRGNALLFSSPKREHPDPQHPHGGIFHFQCSRETEHGKLTLG